MGIPREEALKMSALQVKELLLAHQFALSEEKNQLEREKKKAEALLSQK
jgi:hypothetical protein